MDERILAPEDYEMMVTAEEDLEDTEYDFDEECAAYEPKEFTHKYSLEW